MYEAEGHLREDQIERYSLGETSREELAQCDEHLLGCEVCRHQVLEMDEYVSSMRSAAAAFRSAPPETAPPARLRFPRIYVWGAAATLAACAFLFVPRTARIPAAASVRLAATRGTGGEAARAPARTPLKIQPDVTGLPSWPSYGLEVVDGAGRIAWRGPVTGSSAVVPQLSAGVYYIRVYSPEGKLSREYGMLVEDAR